MKKLHDTKRMFRGIKYLIPRSGTVCRVRLYGRGELRAFRAELELLQRIANAARFQAPARPAGEPKTLTAEAYLELDQILHDALHPLVETTIARVDRDFTDLKKEIDMSAVDEEAKRIVAEATEAGIDITGTPDEKDSSDIVDAMSLNEALDAAEAGLAAAVAGDSLVPAEATTPPTSESPEPETPIEDAGVPGEPEETDWVEIEPTGLGENVADASAGPVEAPEPFGSDDPSEQASSIQQDAAISTEDVENAVAVIEQGIQKLGAILKGELREQWIRAHNALDEVNSSRANFDEECKATREMLEEIARLRDEARVARDEAELARKTLDEVNDIRMKIDEECNATREMFEEITGLRDEARMARDEAELAHKNAKLQREAARVAKERAETSAAAAELAADQAGREVTTIQDTGPSDADG
ncbi:MAG: hypothetical protein IH989_02480 [Planctomycetes bacterium]|nr:hypothetical protein [Planctomycetota bacterium]